MSSGWRDKDNEDGDDDHRSGLRELTFPQVYDTKCSVVRSLRMARHWLEGRPVNAYPESTPLSHRRMRLTTSENDRI